VHTDHEALLGFKEPKNINRRLARYVVELANYNIALKHIPGKENRIPDALSRQPDYDTGKDDNKGVIVLPESMFIKATAQDNPPSALCQEVITAQTANFALLDPLIQRHNLSKIGDLWYKGDTLVVVGDNNLKKGVLHFYHDTPVAGHPGISNTFCYA
jgi:hypothetical protein